MAQDVERTLNHAGAIGLLCRLSVHACGANNDNRDEDLDCIEQCVRDYAAITGGSVRRVLYRIEYDPPTT